MDKTIVALFDNINDAERAIQTLVDHGFSRDQISLMASDRTTGPTTATTTGETTGTTGDGAAAGAGIGAVLGGLTGLLVGIGALAIPGIGPIIAAGPLAAALAGAGLGAATGGVIGALVDAGVPEDEAEYYAEGVRRGGTLVTVRASEGMMSNAVDLLNRHNPVDINQRASSWRESGWSGFDAETSEYRDTGYTSTTATGYTGTGAGSRRDAGFTTDRDRVDVGRGEMDRDTIDTGRTGSTGYHETQGTGTGSGMSGTGSGSFSSGSGFSGTGSDLGSREIRDPSAGGSTGTGKSHFSSGGDFDRASGDIYRDEEPQSTTDRGGTRGSMTGPADTTSYGTGTGGNVAGGSGAGHFTSSSSGMSTSGSYPSSRQSGTGSFGGFNDDEDFFRQDYQRNYATSGFDYERYQPAYRFGYDLHNDLRFRDREWSDMEADVRRDWEQFHPDSAWLDFKDSIRRGWERVKGDVRETFEDTRDPARHSYGQDVRRSDMRVRFDDDFFRQDYQRNFANLGYGYERYQPAYRYGFDMANDERYRGRDWNEVEMDFRRDWEQRNPDNIWDDFKQAVRQGWDRVRMGVNDALD